MMRDEDGVRLTECCGAFSTYVEGVLCCKVCYEEVEVGQGDGEDVVPHDPDLVHLSFNESGVDLPASIDQRTYEPPEGFHLEAYTDEAHLYREADLEGIGDDDEWPDHVAGWQA